MKLYHIRVLNLNMIDQMCCSVVFQDISVQHILECGNPASAEILTDGIATYNILTTVTVYRLSYIERPH